MGIGVEKGLAYGQMGKSLAAVKVPRSVIREWMLDSGCGHDLVSVESAVAPRQCLRKLDEPKWFSTANGTTQADTVIDLDILDIGEVIPLCDGRLS